MENPGVKWGLIGGIGSIMLTLVLYLIDPPMIFGSAAWLGFAIYIATMYMAGNDQKKLQGGYIAWGEALKPTFLTYVLATALYFIFHFILFKFIDPSLLDVQKEVAMQSLEGWADFIGEEGMEAAIQGIEESTNMTVSTQTFGWAFNLIFGFFFGAIISAILKRSKPEYA